MVGVQEVIDLLSRGVGLIRNHVAIPDWWPDATSAAVVAVLAGLVLALWGGRLLRALYVMAFMAIGAAIGVRGARIAQIDILIGLVLGAGVAGLAGHLLYRWWVGMTAGVCAMLVVAAVAGVRNLPDIQREIQTFTDQRLGVGTGRFPLDEPEYQANRVESIRACLAELGAYFWDTRRDVVYRVAFVLGLAGLTGLGMGLTLPRLTTILGSSLIGVLGLALGIGWLLSIYWPGLWAVAVGQAAWFLAASGVVLIVSLAYQARQSRPVAAAPPVAAPAA